MGDTASGRTKGLLLRPSTKEAWTNLSTSWVLGLDPSNTDKFSPRYAQAFTNLFVYLSYLVTAKFQDVPNNSKRSLTIRYVFYYFFFFIYFYFYLPQIRFEQRHVAATWLCFDYRMQSYKQTCRNQLSIDYKNSVTTFTQRLTQPLLPILV